MEMKDYFKFYVRKTTVMVVELVLCLSKKLLRVLLFNYLSNFYSIKLSACGVKFLTVWHFSSVRVS